MKTHAGEKSYNRPECKIWQLAIMADDEIFTLIHGLQERTELLIGTIMTSSGSQRIHSCQKNGLFVCFTSSLKSRPHPSEFVCLTPGQVDPRVGVGAEVPASFQRDKTCKTLEL